MNLAEKINDDIKATMLARDKRKLEALRAIKAALLLAKTGKDVTGGEIPEDVEIKLLQKLVKQRREAADIYKSQNRADLYEEEVYQATIIETYLPAQISMDELHGKIKEIILQVGATSIKDMGKVMGTATKELAGKADNKTISGIIRALLPG